MSHRWVICYRVEGDIRFISHHDTVRLFERALARAAVPIRFSQGFNPRAQLSLPLPRPVGVASEHEVLIIDCEGSLDGSEVLKKISAQLPGGMQVLSARELSVGERLLPCAAAYEVELTERVVDGVAARLRDLESRGQLDIQRRDHKTGRTRIVDLRPFLLEARLDSRRLVWRQAILPSGTAKPAEMMELFGLPPADWVHRLRRMSVDYTSN